MNEINNRVSTNEDAGFKRANNRANANADSGIKRADGEPIRILIVDDETNLSELVSMAVRMEGWQPFTAASGLEAVQVFQECQPDIVVLDIMLPDMDGYELLKRFRARTAGLPVLMLTAKDAVEDRITGLEAGVDDYVTKPFSLEEVILRLKSLLRRSALLEQENAHLLVVDDLVMNTQSHEVTRAGRTIALTRTEFELLRYMMMNPKQVLSKHQILQQVWNYDFGGQANVVELYISYLRKKLDKTGESMIHTVRGAGYVLKPGR